jgi:hypothetical protein
MESWVRVNRFLCCAFLFYLSSFYFLCAMSPVHKGGQSRENCRGTQERTTQKKPYWHTRKENPEKTVGAHKCAPTVFSGFSALVCLYSCLWIVHLCVNLRFSLDCPPLCALRFSLDCPFLCAPTVFSGLSALVCPYGFSWIVLSCVEKRRGTQGQTTQRKP